MNEREVITHPSQDRVKIICIYEIDYSEIQTLSTDSIVGIIKREFHLHQRDISLTDSPCQIRLSESDLNIMSISDQVRLQKLDNSPEHRPTLSPKISPPRTLDDHTRFSKMAKVYVSEGYRKCQSPLSQHPIMKEAVRRIRLGRSLKNYDWGNLGTLFPKKVKKIRGVK